MARFQSPVRLDKFLAKELPSDITRSQIQKLIKSEKILVDGKVCKASQLIEPGQHITVVYELPYDPTLYSENIPLDIVYEDEYLLVINKPPGMIVHPGAGNASGTLVNALLYHCEYLSNENGPYRPGIVHRLDKDTSGLLVAAKDNAVHAGLRKQFTGRKIEKRYLALVWGHMKAPTGDIDLPIGRSPNDRKKFAVVPDGRQSLTRYEVLEEFDFLSLLRLKLETGRTHQIRVHLSHLNHPVFGDPYYGGRNTKMITLNLRNRQLAAKLLSVMKRQALHARFLEFTHPITGATISCEAPLHEDYLTALTRLREQNA
ncbi:MAG: RluA family pseudouridine synthase [Lentisphaeria bacterium]|nr:RluA family pseudouridine synthase [Candidatus Neomarinimicrobiota bacterium]MCF7842308.1 RluA family pseudouridine synthase [Lentisphaeria bacterium]